MYTISITNVNWSATLTIMYTPGAANPNASWSLGGSTPQPFNATSIDNAVAVAVEQAFGVTCAA
jgi:hypothetical protein